MVDKIFIDTIFVIALVNENDQYHKQALELSDRYKDSQFVTTGAVLLEIGNALARNFKQEAVEIIKNFHSSEEIEIVHLDSTLFERAFELFATYGDKTWSLVDCISFVVMKDTRIKAALTIDRHFKQAGFSQLMKNRDA